jgi:hypothetical protein
MYESPSIKEVGSVREITLGDTFKWELSDAHWDIKEFWRIASF